MIMELNKVSGPNGNSDSQTKGQERTPSKHGGAPRKSQPRKASVTRERDSGGSTGPCAPGVGRKPAGGKRRKPKDGENRPVSRPERAPQKNKSGSSGKDKMKESIKDAKDASAPSILSQKRAEKEMIILEKEILQETLKKLQAAEVIDSLGEDLLSGELFDLEAKRKIVELQKYLKSEELTAETLPIMAKAKKIKEKINVVRNRIEYLTAVEEFHALMAGPKPQSQLELEEHKVAEHKAMAACQRYWNGLSEPSQTFSVEDTNFLTNFSLLEEGQACGVNKFLPGSMAPLDRTYYVGEEYDSLQYNLPHVSSFDVQGWKEGSILISEFDAGVLTCFGDQSLAAQAGVSVATTAVVLGNFRYRGIVEGLKAAGGACLASTAYSAYCAWRGLVTHAELRALVVDVAQAGPDYRSKADKENVEISADSIATLRPFMVFDLAGGAKIISFDPSVAGLDNWALSRNKVLRIFSSDWNRRFAPLHVSNILYTEAVSRRTIVTTEFDQARAVERVSKILENCDHVSEDHKLMLATGNSVFKDTLRIVTGVVTRDPHLHPRDF